MKLRSMLQQDIRFHMLTYMPDVLFAQLPAGMLPHMGL
jgi:hypothetical protein